MPLPYSLITNTATQFLGGNLLRNLLGILHTGNTVWFEQCSINYLNLIYIYIYFDSKTYLLLSGQIATSHHVILLVGGGERN